MIWWFSSAKISANRLDLSVRFVPAPISVIILLKTYNFFFFFFIKFQKIYILWFFHYNFTKWLKQALNCRLYNIWPSQKPQFLNKEANRYDLYFTYLFFNHYSFLWRLFWYSAYIFWRWETNGVIHTLIGSIWFQYFNNFETIFVPID